METEAAFAMKVIPTGGSAISIGVLVDSIRAWLQSKDIDSGDARVSKHVSQLISDIAARSQTLSISIMYRDTRQEDRKVGAVLNMGDGDIHKFRMPGAKYISLYIEDRSIENVPWRIAKLSVIGSMGRRSTVIPEPIMYKTWQEWAQAFLRHYRKDGAGASLAMNMVGLDRTLDTLDFAGPIATTPGTILLTYIGKTDEFPAPSAVVCFEASGNIQNLDSVAVTTNTLDLQFSQDGSTWTTLLSMALSSPTGATTDRAWTYAGMVMIVPTGSFSTLSSTAQGFVGGGAGVNNVQASTLFGGSAALSAGDEDLMFRLRATKSVTGGTGALGVFAAFMTRKALA